jgi:hypothetical protein
VTAGGAVGGAGYVVLARRAMPRFPLLDCNVEPLKITTSFGPGRRRKSLCIASETASNGSINVEVPTACALSDGRHVHKVL